ncbi:TPA: NADH-quinone oxidoreductase subunit G [Legionella pneumophila subsp. pneumophila]|uniref:NADH-quinone oxidoreductase subunit NuoG n=1 Tax=Legionella pneumophila TaxID=446 RepID=UPI0007708B4E|nr:NADH-quinone oxidoreductase subunit NuoG [Legionella pneumophila]HAT8862128.1 NADH-quinone oxidoreductase subunit G [Legionella pneumophila subsp. pneumophila]CZI76221.1 NADH-quinone oxidoreductase chain 3 [Legionella pneumophila]HAT9214976.1 NADH-quinone oxidoreductase subunit G [Legionella pneumophila subsp. pneumophila]HAT9261932.1 NADH-quinone oxidoreductase subunit G [Legionella pneumophila subsp. pneumophila]HAT9282847.1 NADH-quinone oxidoreductase subunit G [Legionella pneumophila su
MATIEIDGKTFEAENGKMIIEVADEAGIYIPRFCYHKKLSVAANCRMCLVEVENGRKPVPACATPITNGMKVFTKSEQAIHSQKVVMEFLLINHPLDCPICDQGGECELQDISMGFGADKSEYTESKRAVDDENLGTLISTEMTRCIHCTRCVRFGEEIAGVRELGATGRGEKTQIGTYVEHSMTSEVSGNIIDLCPVGALTSKPYRFKARAWELTQHDSVAPHDCLGSNVHIHTRNNKLLRVVPRENESINETWLSDRDRFSYLGLNATSRASKPQIKKNGQWEVVDWETALKFAAEGISRVIKQHGPEQMAAFASSSSTLEEMYLLQKLMRELGVQNLDHRLQQIDFRDQAFLPTTPVSTLPYAEIDQQHSILLIGCNIHREVPLAGTRVRKAFRNGAKIYALNPVDFDYHFDLSGRVIISPLEMPMQLAKLALALTSELASLPEEVQKLLIGLEVDKQTKQIAQSLKEEKACLITGAIVENHPEASLLRTLVAIVQKLSGAKLVRLTTGANSAGACIAGMLPHRTVAGKSIAEPGLNVQEALNSKLKGYLLMGVEPGYDFANPAGARQSMLAAEFVVLLSAYEHESMHDYADVILPIAPYAETSGTYINIDNTWQTVKGAMLPLGESRPAWKVLRVLGNLLHCKKFDYTSTEDILEEVKEAVSMTMEHEYEPYYPESLPVINQSLVRVGEWPLYRIDAITRNAKELQLCAASESACIRIHPSTADRLKLEEIATVSQGDIEITLPLKRDERIAVDVVWVANAMPETVDLGHSFAAITIKR